MSTLVPLGRTPEGVHDRLAAQARARGLPAPPERPGRGECCGRVCDPCIWDYYERALTRWRLRHALDRMSEPRDGPAQAAASQGQARIS